MANNQLNYTVRFGATTDRASFENVKKSLSSVIDELKKAQIQLNGDSQNTKLTQDARKNAEQQLKDIQKMTAAAEEFKKIFSDSFNQKLGATNLVQFNQALQKSKIDLNELHKGFLKAGDAGAQQFRELTAEILSTNRNLEKTTTFIDKMAETMGNTIKWGISSSIMNSVTGALQESYGYVKDLDKSLNDIRIVSGKSADEMERFAKQANSAAKSLGATTLDYTNAALIYEQQGLDPTQVAARSDVTVKMSNVLGTSADEVSNYMTAIWNNFYEEGGPALEYYADILTKLGAATASSAEEISTGLEKFAAISKTVGLSYEYATAALTTVTATTRQSAEVVGTAFKTLFARIQDLELGETLDDGTTLGKYSEALDKVGISIKDGSGELREMDDILSDMGKKWDTLTKAQQVSLAQTVAGTRQYTQLVALMDNWETFQKNLELTGTATGELDKQQAVYMDSIEAHMNSAKAAWEGAYDVFFDEDTIKGFADAVKVLGDAVKGLVGGLGGGGNTLLALGSTFSILGSKNIAQGLMNLTENSRNAKHNAKILNAELEIMEKFKGANIDDAVIQKIIKYKEEISGFGNLVTDEQQNELDAIINTTVALAEEEAQIKANMSAAEAYAESVREAYTIKEEIGGEEVELVGDKEALARFLADLEEAEGRQSAITKLGSSGAKFTASDSKMNVEERFKGLTGNAQALMDELGSQKWQTFFDAAGEASEDLKNKIIALSQEVSEAKKNMAAANKDGYASNIFTETDMKKVSKAMEDVEKSYKKKDNPSKIFDQMGTEGQEALDAIKSKSTQTADAFDNLKNTIGDTKITESFVKMTGGISQFVSGILTLKNIGNIFTDDNLSVGEKTLQLFVALTSGGMQLAQSYSAIKDSFGDVSNSVKKVYASLVELTIAREAEKASAEGKIAVDAATSVSQTTVATTAKAAEEAEENLAKAEGEAAAMGAVAGASGGAVATGNAAIGTSAAAATPSVAALSATVWSLLWPILLVVAALAVLAVGIYAVVKAYNSDADAAKEAQATADEARKAAEEATNAYNRLSEGMDKYKDGVEALKELTAGTEEYTEALDSANQAVMDLVKADASLAKYVKKRGELYVFEDENGKDVTDDLLNQAKAKMNIANSAADIAQVHANQASLKSQRTNALREAGLHRGDKAAWGAAIGSGFGGYAGAAIGAQIATTNSLTDEQLQQVLQSITDNYGTLTRENLESLSFLNDKEIDALMDNKASLENLAKTTEELNATNKLLLEQSMAESLETNSIITGAKNADGSSLSDKQKNAINALYSEGYTEEKEAEARKKLEDEWYQDKAFGGGNEDEVHAEYAKMMGYTLVDDKSGDKAVFMNKDGEEITVSDDAQRAHIVNTKLAQEMSNYDSKNLQNLTNAVASVDTSAFDKKYGINLDDAFFDAVASGGEFDFSSMFGDISPSELAEMSNLSGEDWQTALGLTDAELETLGFSSAEELAKSIESGLENWEWSPEMALDSALAKGDTAKDLEEKGLDTEEFKNYAEYLMNTADEADNLADSLGEDADAAMTVTRGIMRMNNGVEKLSDNFEGWSDVLKKSDKASEEYYEALTGMQDAMADLLDTEDKYITDNFVQEHMEDIEKAANGDADAIDRLHKELAKEMVLNIATDNEIAQKDIDEFINTINTLEIPDLEAGVVLDGTDEFTQELMKIVENSKMTAEQAKEFFGQMGFDAEFSTTPVDTYNQVPVTKSESEITSVFPLKMTTKTYQDGFQSIKQTVDVPSLTTEDGKPAEVKLTKRAGGSFNNASSSNKGSAKKGGGGSEPKKQDLLKDVIDRYHDVNIELEEIGNSLDKAKKATERLVGQDLINNLADQYALLNKQIDTTAEKINIAKGEMNELKQTLAQKGLQFSADGSISNYASAYQAQIDYVNGIINNYNNMSQSQQEAYQDTLDKAQEDFEKFKEDLARYDELLVGEIPGLEGEIQDAILEQIALKLDAFHHEIEIRLNMAEAERDWNSFFNKVIKDIDESDILGNAEAKLEDFMSYYKDNMEGVIQTNAQHIQDILTDLKLMDEGAAAKYYSKDGVDNRAQALDDLKTYYEQLMSDLEAVHDLSDEIHESYVSMIDEAQEKFDEQISTFDTINSLLEHDKNIISMIYGEESYSALSQFYDRQEENYNKQLDFQKQQVEFWKQQMATAEEGSDAWNAAKENWLSAVDAWNSAIETAIENLQDKYLNAINAIFQALNDKSTGGMGLGYVETEWDLINQNADQYLDTVNAIYKVQELQNKYLDAIEKSSSPTQQKKLNDLMQQETDYLREQDKLSEYDLERANLKYEIALKQMALEDAQQNKSKLRLRRDSQGNYTYQYTQDEDQVASIQSEIADLYNQLYNLDADAYKGNLEEIFNIWQEFQEKMSEAAQINDPEQRAAKELLIKEQYSDLINGLVEKNENLQANMYQSTMSHLFDLYNQNTANYDDMSEDQKAILDQFISAETDLNNAAFDNLFDLYNVNIEQFTQMTEEQKDILMDSMVPQWNSGVQQMIDKIAGEGGFAGICKDAFEELDKATEDYMAGLEELQKNADVSFEEVKEGIDEVIVDTETLLENNDELIDSYNKELEAIQSVIDQLDDLISKYDDARIAAEEATRAAYEYWQQEQNKNAQADTEIDTPTEDTPTIVDNTPTTTPVQTEPAKPSLNTGSYVEVKSGTRWYANSYGGGSSGAARSGKISYINLNGSHPYNIGGLGWIKKTDIVGYDTGGYTGDWNSGDGRLAMLHKKELVLNAHDTDNMLNAITILRDLTANLGASLINKMASITSGNIGTIGQGMPGAGLEQSVVINAEFPNATSAREIEDAINNLVNRASQHITK